MNMVHAIYITLSNEVLGYVRADCKPENTRAAGMKFHKMPNVNDKAINDAERATLPGKLKKVINTHILHALAFGDTSPQAHTPPPYGIDSFEMPGSAFAAIAKLGDEKGEANSSDPRKEDIPPKDRKELHVGCGSARRQPCNLYSICFVGFHLFKSSVTTVFMRKE